MTIKNLKLFKKFCIFICTFTFYLLPFTFIHNAYALSQDKIKAAFLAGDYKSAIAEGERLLANLGNYSPSDELYYILGLSYLKDGNYLRASDIFEIILKESKGSAYKEEAALSLGDTYFLRGDFPRAEDCYRRLLKDRPDTKLKAQLFFRLSQAGFKKGDSSQGKDYLAKLKQECPLSPEYIMDRELILPVDAASDFYYTVQVGSFSNIANAKNLAQRLTQDGYPAYIENIESAKGASYRVRVGKMRLRQEAAELEGRLSREGYPTKIFP